MIAALLIVPRVWEGDQTPGEGQSESAEQAYSAPAEPKLADIGFVDRVSSPVQASEGGTIAAPGGEAQLSIPPDALSEDTTVEIARFAVDHEQDLTGYAVDLLPDGLQLQQPAQVSFQVPAGVSADALQIVVFEPTSGRWMPEPRQQPTGASDTVISAEIDHFSLRRLRIRPGMNFPYDPNRTRGTLLLASDAQNGFEQLVDGRWRSVRRASARYRELIKIGRVGRHSLIVTGRLRAVSAPRPRPELILDQRRTVSLPAGAAEARTGWARVTLLDPFGRATEQSVIARVVGSGPKPGLQRAGVAVALSRATLEALGLRWSREFGIDPDNPERVFIRYDASIDADAPQSAGFLLPYVPIRVEAYQPARQIAAERDRMW